MTRQLTDQDLAAKWAYDLLQAGNFCILDTETTGLGSQAEIVELALIDHEGFELLNVRVSPTVAIEPEAEAIHGISQDDLKMSPPFPQIFLELWEKVGQKALVIYNAEFDLRMIRQSLRPYNLPIAFPTSDRRQCRIFLGGGSIHCAMLMYSQWVGEWNGARASYRWQKLPGGDHSAIGDCLATLDIIRKMAASWEASQEPLPQAPEFDEIPF